MASPSRGHPLRQHRQCRTAEGWRLASGLCPPRRRFGRRSDRIRARRVRRGSCDAGDPRERPAARIRGISADGWAVRRGDIGGEVGVPGRWQRVSAEAIGTFFLVFIGPGAAMVNAATGASLGVTGIALAFAFVITGMIYAVGHISGAHLNPAVTVAFWSARRFPSVDVAPYIVAQCVGAVLASLVLRAALGLVGHLGATLPSVAPAISVATAFGIEFALSFALMFV